MVTVDDVAKLVKDRLAGTADFATVLPGGAWLGRGPDVPDVPGGYPYEVHQVEAGPAENYSGPAYTQAFTIRLAAYAPVGQAGADPQAVQRFLFAAVGTEAANAALQGTGLRNASEAVLHARPVNPDGEFDPTAREGRDVFVCGLAVEILVQGDRGVN